MFGLSGLPFDMTKAFGENSILGNILKPEIGNVIQQPVGQQLPWQAADPANPGPQLPWQRPDFMAGQQQPIIPKQDTMGGLGGLLQAQQILNPQKQEIAAPPIAPRSVAPSMSPQSMVNTMIAQARPSVRGLLGVR